MTDWAERSTPLPVGWARGTSSTLSFVPLRSDTTFMEIRGGRVDGLTFSLIEDDFLSLDTEARLSPTGYEISLRRDGFISIEDIPQ